MKMEQTGRSETSAYKIQTPGNYPKESIQHKEGFSRLSLSACPNVIFCALKVGQYDTISPF